MPEGYGKPLTPRKCNGRSKKTEKRLTNNDTLTDNIPTDNPSRIVASNALDSPARTRIDEAIPSQPKAHLEPSVRNEAARTAKAVG